MYHVIVPLDNAFSRVALEILPIYHLLQALMRALLPTLTILPKSVYMLPQNAKVTEFRITGIYNCSYNTFLLTMNMKNSILGYNIDIMKFLLIEVFNLMMKRKLKCQSYL